MAGLPVSLLCVRVKATDAPEKVKLKILKGLRKVESGKATSISLSQPVRKWTEDIHAIAELSAEEVSNVVSNSQYIALLCTDGRVCRFTFQYSSLPNTLSKKECNLISVLRQPTPTFQELSDAEYARQIQAEMAAGVRNIPSRR